ncbi:hypothetical protein BDB00DRAFT_863633 [Zychaea mexicana]|uniref:uncharacterized protein n=1 Tax=Zychaea mexicana TaxID=64656 RepID=UPI0022FE8529|nr:uncharacterized protein BDB00DRAFT_863633 [Zychaea mexicana]KAI9468676.1 hypothetical protein BDB00DRAFT_863633 [Zychaea mexicana]
MPRLCCSCCCTDSLYFMIILRIFLLLYNGIVVVSFISYIRCMMISSSLLVDHGRHF